MEKLFTPQELAIKLKELGFDEPCACHWERGTDSNEWGLYMSGHWSLSNKDLITQYLDDNNELCGEFSAPTWEQAFDYFRKIHKIESCIHINYSYEILGGIHTKGYPNTYHIESDPYKTYEEARLKCLIKLIDICNEKE